MKRSHTPKARKRWTQSGRKRGKKIQKWSMVDAFFLLLAHVLPPLFLSFHHSLSSSRRPCLGGSVHLSSSLTRISGWWPMVVVVVSGWWWLWWGGSWFLRAYTAPYLSFLSLWEGEEGPRSRALRTEFIIDRAISLTAPRRSWTEAESSRFCLSLRFYGSVISVSANAEEESTGITKVRDLLLFLDRTTCLDHHTDFNSLFPDARETSYYFLCLICSLSTAYLWSYHDFNLNLFTLQTCSAQTHWHFCSSRDSHKTDSLLFLPSHPSRFPLPQSSKPRLALSSPSHRAWRSREVCYLTVCMS